jgi:Family of unknown function (DUF6460)
MAVLTRVLGDSPWRVLLKLLVASLLVGIVLATLGWSPAMIYAHLIEFAQAVWDMGFDAILRFKDYILLGAGIVIPIFIVMRLLSWKREG